MKATLEFQYPEQKELFKIHEQAIPMLQCLRDLELYLKENLKFEDLPADVRHGYQRLDDKLKSLLKENDVKLY